VQVYYSKFSVLEPLYDVAKFKRSSTFDKARFEDGLRSVIDGGTYERSEEGAGSFSRANELRDLGRQDMIDNIPYASSVENGLRLLTVDQRVVGSIVDLPGEGDSGMTRS
jgi:hypothetical protein